MQTALASQFGNPQGLIGEIVGLAMAIKNRPRNNWALEQLKVQRGDRILEIGFGSGAAIQQLSQMIGPEIIVGLDHSETMVNQAMRRNREAIQKGKVQIQQGCVSKIPYSDGTFTKVFSSNCHFFWSDPIHNFQEINRILQPGGILLLCWQPRWALNPEMLEASANKTLEQVTAAGFRQLNLQQKNMKPVPALCLTSYK